MTDDSPNDPQQQLDETASAYVDGQLDDAERQLADGHQSISDRVRAFSSLRAELLGDPAGSELATDSDEAAVSAQIDAALAVFDELFPVVPGFTVTPADGTPAGVEAIPGAPETIGFPLHIATAAESSPPLSSTTHQASPHSPTTAPISLDAHRRKRAASAQRLLTIVGVAAAVALAVFGLSRIGGSDSKSSQKASSPPVFAAAATTSPALRPQIATGAPAPEQQSTGALATASARADGDASASAAAEPVPSLATTDDIAQFVHQRLADNGATAANPAGADGGAAGTSVASAAPTTMAASASATTTAGTVAAATIPAPGAVASATTVSPKTTTTTSSKSSVTNTSSSSGFVGEPCDVSEGAQDLGLVTWQGQLADVIVHAGPDGSYVATLFGSSCGVLTTAIV